MRAIVTHCDKYYVTRVCALVESIQSDVLSPEIFIYTHDHESQELLEVYFQKRIRLIPSAEISEEYEKLQDIRSTRSRMEYLFALTPFMIKFALEKLGATEIFYVDSDILFLGKFSEVEKEVEGFDVAITLHNFDKKLQNLNKYGKFNVGLVYMNNSQSSREILNWWALKCLESTSTEENSDIYGDQKYLDKFDEFQGNVLAFMNTGFNVAPWNSQGMKRINGKFVMPDESPMLFYHFSGLRIYRFVSFLGFSVYSKKPSRAIRKYLYAPYIKELITISKKLSLDYPSDSRKLSFKKCILALYKNDFISNSFW